MGSLWGHYGVLWGPNESLWGLYGVSVSPCGSQCISVSLYGVFVGSWGVFEGGRKEAWGTGGVDGGSVQGHGAQRGHHHLRLGQTRARWVRGGLWGAYGVLGRAYGVFGRAYGIL